MTSLDHVYSLCMFYRCMGEFYAGSSSKLFEQFGGQNIFCRSGCVLVRTRVWRIPTEER